MPELHTIEDRSSPKLRGRDRRSLNLSTKLTTIEAQAVEEAASRAGKTPSEWARDVLLRPEALGKGTEMEVHLFTELIGIEMLMMKTLEPILRGERLEPDQIAVLFRQVQSTKAAKAQELLARRGHKPEK